MSEKLEGTSMFRRHRETHRRETEREGIRAFSRPSGRSRLAEANGLGKLVEGLFQGDSNAFGEVFKAASVRLILGCLEALRSQFLGISKGGLEFTRLV
eukprot:149212-Amorphochlora_amoeboformis.AAC.1